MAEFYNSIFDVQVISKGSDNDLLQLQDFQRRFVEIQVIKFMSGYLRFSFFDDTDETQSFPIAVVEMNAKGAAIRCKQAKNSNDIVTLSQSHRTSINFRFKNYKDQEAHLQLLRSFLNDLNAYRKSANREMEQNYIMENGFHSLDDSIGAYQFHYMKYQEKLKENHSKASKSNGRSWTTDERWSFSKFLKRVFK